MLKNLCLLILLSILSLPLSAQTTDTAVVKSHLIKITKTPAFRNYRNVHHLNQVAKYIADIFNKYSANVSTQEYSVDNEVYKNVICSFGPKEGKRIIVGAHYDVCNEQEGADDNASGIVGLLELARQLQGKSLTHRIDLVAYTLEEPPYFRTQYMGSYIHAESLHKEGADVFGMVSLEMIGYFKDEEKSQSYPLGILSWLYGSKGNYITLVKKFFAGNFARSFGRKFRDSNLIKTKTFSGPKALPGIDFSDHLNYWKFGYSALMITDTSFYRNKNYHEKTDILETLDINRMARVIDSVYLALIQMN